MANHVRRQIREAAAAALTGLATTAGRVYGFRVVSLQPADLPALCVYTVAEQALAATIHSPALIERTIDLRVLGFVKGAADLDDTMDLIAGEVERALAAGLTIGSRSFEVAYQGCDMRYEAGEKKAGEIEMQFSVLVFNAANAPDVFS